VFYKATKHSITLRVPLQNGLGLVILLQLIWPKIPTFSLCTISD